MEIAYFDLSGGINQASTKTELGLNTKKIYWSDSENIEILQNRGICKQKGNELFLKLPEEVEITGLFEMFANNTFKLLITTQKGDIYVYNDTTKKLDKLIKTLKGEKPYNSCNGIRYSIFYRF